MEIPHFFLTIEESGLSVWIRDNPFWLILSFHAIGMALLVGASAIIDLRLLGVARDLPIAPLKKLYAIIWLGFWIQVVTGGLLLIGYPTKSLTNWDFYLKLFLIGVALAFMLVLKKKVFADESLNDADMMARGKVLAVFTLVLWLAAITAGRMLAYTFTYITYPS